MKKRCLLFALLCVIGSTYCDEEPSGDSAVIDLTTDTFDDVIANSPVILVEFFAPW